MTGAALALLPDWAEPVVRYILEVGLPATLRVSAFAVVGATLIGILLGTLLTIEFLPRRRRRSALYIEVFRGLPILVTVFIVYFGLPSVSPRARVRARPRHVDRAHPLGQRAGRRGDPRRRRSRSRASSTRRRRRSASAGSAATAT